jgi:hypothetical protein
MKTIGKIYFLLNALALTYIGYEIEGINSGQIFALAYLVIVCLLGSYIIHTNDQKTLS